MDDPRRPRDLTNPYFAGEITMHGETRRGNHDPLVSPDRWHAIQATLQRLDPAAVSAVKRAGARRRTT